MLMQNPMPRYRWLENLILRDIQSGIYQPGEQLPTEHQLMALHNLSSTTVRRTLRELESQGIIYRQAGKGTFVRPFRVEENLLRLTSFAEEMAFKNLQPSFKLLSAKNVPSPIEIAQALQISSDEEVFLIERLQLADGIVIALAVGYWLLSIGNTLKNYDLECCALYDLVESQMNISLAEATENIQATTADKSIAKKMQIEPGSPLLVRRRVTFSNQMQPVEHTTTYYCADRYEYKLRLLRQSA